MPHCDASSSVRVGLVEGHSVEVRLEGTPLDAVDTDGSKGTTHLRQHSKGASYSGSLKVRMGSILGKGQVDPRAPTDHHSSRKLLMESEGEVSRASFTFHHKLASDGYLTENSLWMASSTTNSKDRYLIRQFDKEKYSWG